MPGEISPAQAVESEGVTDVGVATPEIAGIDQLGPGRVQGGHERIVRAAGPAGLKCVTGREVCGYGVTAKVDVASGVDGQAVGLIIEAASDESGELQRTPGGGKARRESIAGRRACQTGLIGILGREVGGPGEPAQDDPPLPVDLYRQRLILVDPPQIGGEDERRSGGRKFNGESVHVAAQGIVQGSLQRIYRREIIRPGIPGQIRAEFGIQADRPAALFPSPAQVGGEDERGTGGGDSRQEDVLGGGDGRLRGLIGV